MPDFSLSTFAQLAPIAFAVTLFALTEAVSIARSLAARSGQYIDGNQEFIGIGASGTHFAFYRITIGADHLPFRKLFPGRHIKNAGIVGLTGNAEFFTGFYPVIHHFFFNSHCTFFKE